jgi:hypothetical protein
MDKEQREKLRLKIIEILKHEYDDGYTADGAGYSDKYHNNVTNEILQEVEKVQ